MSAGMIINLGLPKSGTTTLARAFARAGLRVADWRLKGPGYEAKPFIAPLMYQGYYETGDPLHHLKEFEALSEVSLIAQGKSMWPQLDLLLLTAIRRLHPQTRFLLTWRGAEVQAESMMRWTNLGSKRLPGNDVPGLPKGFGSNAKELAHWIEGHAFALRDLFDGDPHFLALDIGAEGAREELAGFIGRDLPWWGRANQNHAGKDTPRDEAGAA